MFIHDALSELVVCGETDILAANIRINTNRMKELSVWFIYHMMIKCMSFQ